MKKVFGVLIVIFIMLITACSGGTEADNLTLNSIIHAYENKGVEVDTNKKPIFSMIGATDGVIFYVEGNKVAIYEYKSDKDLLKAKSENPLIEGWESRGKYLLETSNPEAKEIFNAIK